MSLAVAAQHEGGDPRVVGHEVVGEGVPPPRPEQRHRVQRDDDVDRVVVACGEDEEGLRRAQQYAEIGLGMGLGLGVGGWGWG